MQRLCWVHSQRFNPTRVLPAIPYPAAAVENTVSHGKEEKESIPPTLMTINLKDATYFDRPYTEKSDIISEHHQYLKEMLCFHLPPVIVDLVIDGLLWILKPGSVLDVIGMTAGLNMFFPSSARWDVCWVLATTPSAIQVQPVDRMHPYSYMYHNYTKTSEWIPLTSNRLAPYLSRVDRCEPRLAKEYDLVDVYNSRTGLWQCAEVCANVESALWVLIVDNYYSAEYKNLCREWISTHADNNRLARYGTNAPKTHPSIALKQFITLKTGEFVPVVDRVGYKLLCQPVVNGVSPSLSIAPTVENSIVVYLSEL